MKISFAALTTGLLQVTKLAKAQVSLSAECLDTSPDSQFPMPPNDFLWDNESGEMCNATNPSGRKFHCEPWDGNGDFPNCIHMDFDFGSHNIHIDSCPTADPPLLEIADDPPTPLGPGDVEWLESLMFKLKCGQMEAGEGNCNWFCAFQALRAIEIILEWDDATNDAPKVWSLDAAVEKAHQTPPRIVLENGGSMELPLFLGGKPGTYASLCPHVGDYLEDPYYTPGPDTPTIFGKIALDHGSIPGNCPPGQMRLLTMGGTLMTPCAPYPFVLPPSDYALKVEGDCFGRCGLGCDDGITNTQFTLDCADYDFCVRLSEEREEGDNPDCMAEFLHTIDDRMWSGNCDGNVETPCNANCDNVTPPPIKFNKLDAVIKTIEAEEGNCNDACASYAGTVAGAPVNAGELFCSASSLEYTIELFTESEIVASMNSLGFTCEEDGSTPAVVPASDSGTVPKYYDPDDNGRGPCFASNDHPPRPESSFDCAAVPQTGETRICSCYKPTRR